MESPLWFEDLGTVPEAIDQVLGAEVWIVAPTCPALVGNFIEFRRGPPADIGAARVSPARTWSMRYLNALKNQLLVSDLTNASKSLFWFHVDGIGYLHHLPRILDELLRGGRLLELGQGEGEEQIDVGKVLRMAGSSSGQPRVER